MKYCCLLIFLLSFSLQAQQNTPQLAHVKATMIFRIIHDITWKHEIDTFSIGILGVDSAMSNELLNLTSNHKLKGKPVIIKQFSRVKKIKNVHLLYVSPARTPTVDRVANKIRGKSILLISDESKSRNTMINFYINQQVGGLEFNVYRKNIEKEGIKPSEQILIYGGDRQDIKNIISKNKKILQGIEDTLQIQRNILKLKEIELQDQIKRLQDQKKIITNHQYEIHLQDSLLANQKRRVAKQEKYIYIQKHDVASLSEEIKKQQNLLNQKIHHLQSKDDVITQKEDEITTHTKTLNHQQHEIEEKQKLIENQEKTLLGHADIIILQRRLIYISIGFSLLIFILVIIAYQAYRATKRQSDMLFKKNKEIREQNQEINYQKRILLEKTEELNTTNSALIERQDEIQQQTDKLMEQSIQLKFALEQAEQATTLISQEKQRAEEAFKELESTQSQLINAEKLASLGQVAAGVAHEVNTPLGAIKASISTMLEQQETLFSNLLKVATLLTEAEGQLFFNLIRTSQEIYEFRTSKEERKFRRKLTRYLEEKVKVDADVLADNLVDMGFLSLEKIEPFISLLQHQKHQLLIETAYNFTSLNRDGQNILIAVNKAAKVIYALKSYARVNNSNEMQTVNLEDNISTVLTLYYNQIKQGIELVTNYQKDVVVTCFPDELNQVWTNLIHNAIQAMDNQGILTITVEQKEEMIFVKINDTGCGIPNEIKNDIFTPFFTTKAMGEGSGLGLDIVQKILKHHQGNIHVESEKNNTTFTVCLPLMLKKDN